MNDRQPCDECEAMAVWQWAPADSYGSYCDAHVPRGCSCNNTWNDETDELTGPEARDEDGRLLPCIEIEFDASGFAPGDKEEVLKYRARNNYSAPTI